MSVLRSWTYIFLAIGVLTACGRDGLSNARLLNTLNRHEQVLLPLLDVCKANALSKFITLNGNALDVIKIGGIISEPSVEGLADYKRAASRVPFDQLNCSRRMVPPEFTHDELLGFKIIFREELWGFPLKAKALLFYVNDEELENWLAAGKLIKTSKEHWYIMNLMT